MTIGAGDSSRSERDGARDRLNTPRPSQPVYLVSCTNSHDRTLTPTELEDLIAADEHKCPTCQKGLTLKEPAELNLECYVCSMVFEVSSLEEAQFTIDSGCAHCDGYGFGDAITVPGSWQAKVGAYKWMRSDKNPKALSRRGRTDYWEGAIHFCDEREFISIYGSKQIRAAPTGYFRVPAVCLTEVPPQEWAEIRGRHGQFGYLFKKRDLIANGGCPVSYLSEAMIQSQQEAGGFSRKVQPFVNLLRIPSVEPARPKHDFLHEREWRVPHDIDLRILKPFGVVLGEYGPHTSGWTSVIDAAMEYSEIGTIEDDE